MAEMEFSSLIFGDFLDDELTIVILSNRANTYAEGLAGQINNIVFPR